jgi:hypothetical protein
MLLSEIVCQEGIVDRTREGYVNDSTRMDVPDLSVSELKFHPAKAVWTNRNLLPPRHFLFEFLQVKLHDQSPLLFSMIERKFAIRGILRAARGLNVEGATFEIGLFTIVSGPVEFRERDRFTLDLERRQASVFLSPP